MAEKLRKYIEGYDFPSVRRKTASFGVSCYLKKGNENQDRIVGRAYRALYRAKENKKNRL